MPPVPHPMRSRSLRRSIRTALDSRTATRTFRLAILCFIYIVVASVVLSLFMARGGFSYSNKRYGFVAMMSYEASRPWAYRVLIPAAVNTVSALVPDRFLESHRDKWLKDSGLLEYEYDDIQGDSD